MSGTVQLVLTPADVLMFRETRPFGQVLTGTKSLFPTPRAAAGAVRTWLLRGLFPNEFDSLRGQVTTKALLEKTLPEEARWVLEARLAGPFLCHNKPVVLPAPLHVVRTDVRQHDGWERKLHVMQPLCNPPPGWRPPKGLPEKFQSHFRPLWALGAGDGKPISD